MNSNYSELIKSRLTITWNRWILNQPYLKPPNLVIIVTGIDKSGNYIIEIYILSGNEKCGLKSRDDKFGTEKIGFDIHESA